MSRAQLGERIGMSGETIGRWERGEWRDGPPRAPMLEALVRASGLLDLLVEIQLSEEADPATRFAAAARREAQRQRERQRGESGARTDEGAEGGAS